MAGGRPTKRTKKRKAARVAAGRRTKRTKKRKAARVAAGRPTKCTTKLIKGVCAKILKGGSLQHSAGAAGVDWATLKRWRLWAKEGKEPYAQLCAPLKRAVARAIMTAEQRVKAGKYGWQGSARWLESIDRENWQRTERLEQVHSGGLRLNFPDLERGGPDAAVSACERAAKLVKHTTTESPDSGTL